MASADEAAAAKAIGMIQELTATPELNKTYLGKVQRITDFGAFVEIMPGTDGLLHVSEIANYRVKDVRDELKEGQQVLVKVINIDPTGKIRLSPQGAAAARRGRTAGGRAGSEPRAATAAATGGDRGDRPPRDRGRAATAGRAATRRGTAGASTIVDTTSAGPRLPGASSSYGRYNGPAMAAVPAAASLALAADRVAAVVGRRPRRPGAGAQPPRRSRSSPATTASARTARGLAGRPGDDHLSSEDGRYSFAIDAYRIDEAGRRRRRP